MATYNVTDVLWHDDEIESLIVGLPGLIPAPMVLREVIDRLLSGDTFTVQFSGGHTADLRVHVGDAGESLECVGAVYSLRDMVSH